MKGFLAVTRREIFQRRLLLAAAAVCSVVPFAVTLVRGVSGTEAANIRSWVAFVQSSAFAIGLVAVSGASMLAPALASRRIAFDFSRPLSAFAIWAGHLAAAISLALLSAAMLWVPAWVSGSLAPWKELFVDTEPPPFWPLLLVAGLLFLFSAMHAVSVMFRSRSPLVALDAVAALAIGFGFSAVLSRLPSFMADGPRTVAVWAFVLSAGVAALLAGLASVARGRTDIRAAHRALSLVLWGSLAAALLGINGYASWVLAARPADLKGFWASPAPAGSWVVVQGEARGARADFLYDTARARSERIAVVDWRGPEISRNGKQAVWVEGRDHGGPLEVLALALDDPKARPSRTRLILEGYPSLMILSADGSRLATMERGVLSIHDLASARTLASARVAGERTDVRGFFADNDTFRVYRQPEIVADKHGETRLEILELDAASKTLRETGGFTGAERLYLVANRSGDRVVATQYANREVWLLDGRTGAALARLAAGAEQTSRWPGFLADGRIVLTERSPQGARLRVFLADGTERRTVPVEAPGYFFLGGEVAPGKLVVALGEGPRYSASLAGVDDGSVGKIADGLYPAARLAGFSYEINAGPTAESEATKLFFQGRVLVRLDPLTGERRVILEARRP